MRRSIWRSVKTGPVPAVVVGGGLNALGVVRSLGRAKLPCIVVAANRHDPAVHSRYCRAIICNSFSDEALVSQLLELASEYREKPVLFLTMEETVAQAMVAYETLVAAYRMTLSNPATVVPLLSKDGFRALAERHALAIPKTRLVESSRDLPVLETLQPPLVVKPATRDKAYDRCFAKAYRCETLAEANALIEQMLKALPRIMVQEWVDGSDSDIYFCLQYLPPNRRTEPASFVGRKIRSWPPAVGGTASCTSAPEASQLVQRTTDFFQEVGIHGLASMEYKWDRSRQEYLAIEPTVGRTDFQEEVATLHGCNLPWAAYADAMGLSSKSRCSRTGRFIWRDRISDSQALERSPEAVVPASVEVIDALWRAHDPGPEIHSLGRRVIARGRRTLDKVKPRAGQ